MTDLLLAEQKAACSSHAEAGKLNHKLLVVVWHVLTKDEADRHTNPKRVATKMMMHAYTLKEQRRPSGQSTPEYVHRQLKRLGIPLQSFRMNGRTIVLQTADS